MFSEWNSYLQELHVYSESFVGADVAGASHAAVEGSCGGALWLR
jgi:hypothetical protein